MKELTEEFRDEEASGMDATEEIELNDKLKRTHVPFDSQKLGTKV